MDRDDRLLRVRVHIGLILQADDMDAARDLIRAVYDFVRGRDGLVFVHKDVSADKLWLKRGGDGP